MDRDGEAPGSPLRRGKRRGSAGSSSRWHDSEIFEKNELLSHICNDLKYINQILNDAESKQKIQLIENDCIVNTAAKQ
ncbi:MAG: hypothetical protein P8Y49_04795 [Sulfurovaceae bacterium]